MKRSSISLYVLRVMFLYQPSLAFFIPMWLVRELLPVELKYLFQPILPIPLLLPPDSLVRTCPRRITWPIHVFASLRVKKPEDKRRADALKAVEECIALPFTLYPNKALRKSNPTGLVYYSYIMMYPEHNFLFLFFY